MWSQNVTAGLCQRLPAFPVRPAPVGAFAPVRAPRIKNTRINYPFVNQPRPSANLLLGRGGLMNSTRPRVVRGRVVVAVVVMVVGLLCLKRGEGCEDERGNEVGGRSLSDGMRPSRSWQPDSSLARTFYHQIEAVTSHLFNERVTAYQAGGRGGSPPPPLNLWMPPDHYDPEYE